MGKIAFDGYTRFLEFVLGVIAISLATNILTASLPDYGLWGVARIVGSVVVILGVTAFWFARVLSGLSGAVTFKPTILYDKATAEFLVAPGYDFSDKLEDYRKAAVIENPDLKHAFELAFRELRERKSFGPGGFEALVRESTEYYMLSKLSTFLTDYFSQQGLETVAIERAALSEIVASNRFIDLFSRPMEQRRAFSNRSFGGSVEFEQPGARRVVMAFGEEGELFEELQFDLPARSSVSRKPSGNIELRTRGFVFTIQTECRGFSDVIPSHFPEKVWGRSWPSVGATNAEVSVSYRVELPKLMLFGLRRTGFWVSEFCDTLGPEVDFDAYLARVNWPMLAMMEEMSLQARKTRSKGRRQTKARVDNPSQ